MVPDVRCRVRPQAAPAPAEAGRHLAPRGGVPAHQWPAALPLARGGPARGGAGHPRAGPPERHGRQAALQAAPGRPEARATQDRHRRPAELRRGAPRAPARRPAPDQPLPQQPGRALASADPPPGAADAALRGSGASAAPPVIARHDLRPLPSAAAPDERRSASSSPRQGLSDSGAGDVRPDRRARSCKARHTGVAHPLPQ